MTTRFLTVDELIHINHQLIGATLPQNTLAGQQKVRDLDLLKTAQGRPTQTVFGEDAFPSLIDKATALFESIARNHPFADGNKRTATIAMIWMLAVNGQRITWNAAEALDRIVQVAEGQLNRATFADWLRTEPTDPVLEPDDAHDQQMIAQIIRDHAWLLTELDKR